MVLRCDGRWFKGLAPFTMVYVASATSVGKAVGSDYLRTVVREMGLVDGAVTWRLLIRNR